MIDAVPEIASVEALDDLRQRLLRSHRIPNPWGADASFGLQDHRIDALIHHWATGFDWRAPERRLRGLPWALTGGDKAPLRVVHRPSDDSDVPVVLLHGWPDSVLRFERLLPLLTDIGVVVPALPGHPFAPPPECPVSAREMATMVAEAMAELGYDRYVLSGGDVGGTVAEILAAEHPDRVAALHLTNLAPARAAILDRTSVPDDVIVHLERVERWRKAGGGFVAEQATRPGTLTVALGDSPAGLLAWIAEKLLDWSVGDAFASDDVLTWVSASWLTGSIGTSFSTYAVPSPLPRFIGTPTVFSAFAGDLMPEPRDFVRRFVDLAAFVEHPVGGHFAAWEQPDLYVADLRLALEVAG